MHAFELERIWRGIYLEGIGKINSTLVVWADIYSDIIIPAYTEIHRKFHTLGHIADAMGAYFSIARGYSLLSQKKSKPDIPLISLFMHDIRHWPINPKNEEMSAEFAAALFSNILPAPEISEMRGQIIATGCKIRPVTLKERAVRDADRASFAKPAGQFFEDEKKFRDECRPMLGDREYVGMQREFFEKIMNGKGIYFTKRGSWLFENRARQNIGRYLQRLTSACNHKV